MFSLLNQGRYVIWCVHHVGVGQQNVLGIQSCLLRKPLMHGPNLAAPPSR